MSKRFQYAIVTASTCLLLFLMLGVVLGKGSAAEDGKYSAYRHFNVFTDVVSRIKSEYVEEPQMKSVALGALNGMLEAIDPYASYLNEDQYKQYLKAKESDMADVGLILSRRSGYIGIVDAIPGSPADVIGLTTGDIIESIGDVSTRDMPLAYAEYLLRGQSGTNIKMSVMRIREGTEAQQIGLTRTKIAYPRPEASIIGTDIGYLKVPTLDSGKLADVSNQLKGLEKQGAKKLILDLRYDSVGEAQDGAALANLFLDKGLMGYLEGQKVPRRDFQADTASTVSKLPLVVIANRGTGGPAEIAAAALLGDKRAEVVGERTYGLASERKALTMQDGSAVILSVAKYYSPDGKAIQDNGVMPSVPVVVFDAGAASDDDNNTPAPQPKSNDDIMLRKAVQVLTEGVEAAKKDTQQIQGPISSAEPLQMRPLNIPGPR